MTDDFDRSESPQQAIVSLPGAGRRTLLAALDGDLCLPEGLRLCLLDASRMEAPEQTDLLRQLAAEPEQTVIFVLNKADLVGNPQTLVMRARALLRAQGFERAELYLTSAEAAKRFRQVFDDRPQSDPMQTELLFNRFRPDANDLAAFSGTEESTCKLGGRTVSVGQLTRAMENTGVPVLEARLRALMPARQAEPECPRAPRREPEFWFDPDALFSPQQSAASVFEKAKTQTAPAAEPVIEPQPVSAEMAAALNQISTLADLQEAAKRADCVTLHQMMTAVQAGELLPDCSREALDCLYPAFELREKWELQALTEDLETLELNELLRRQDRINHSVYVLQTRAPYAERVLARIEQKQTEQLEAMCAELETADLAQVKRIRNRIEAFDCPEVLKQPFYEELAEQEDALGREALERFTAGAEEMSVKELRKLALALESGNWNQRVVDDYRHRIALLSEAATVREVQAELNGLNDMERREVIAVRDRIMDKSLPARFTAAAMAQIEQRLFQMDMLRLMAMNNDFNRMDFTALDDLRTKIKYTEVCQAAKNEYYRVLKEREKNCALELAFARVELARRLAGKSKIRPSDIRYAEKTQDYDTKVEDFWGNSTEKTPKDLPVFLLTNVGEFAFTGSRFYYKDEKGLHFVLLKDIAQFHALPEKMKLRLQIEGKDNSFNCTEAQIARRGASRTLEFLNDCCRRWDEPGLDKPLPTAETHIEPFDASRYLRPVPSVILNREQARSIFQDDMAADKNHEGVLIRREDPNSLQRMQKTLQAFELPDTTQLLWFDVSTILGIIRGGVALGENEIYLKEGKQPTVTIPIQEIYQVEKTGKKQVTVKLPHNRKVQLPIAGEMAKPLANYVLALQLSFYLRKLEEQHE